MSARPWPEYAMPTAEQFADWYGTADREERIRIATAMLCTSEVANRCFQMNHEGMERELAYLRRRSGRYRLAWLSARRRIHLANFLRAYYRAASTEPTP